MTRKTLSILLLLFITQLFYGQTNNHPTISNIKVAYKPATQSAQMSSTIQCIPNASISLKANCNATKIHFKMINKETNIIIYQVSYLLNSPLVTSTEGIKLFEKNGNDILISSGQYLPLKPYLYQIETEDVNGNRSLMFTAVR